MSLRSPKSPQQRGFLPISGDSSTTATDMQDIPLRTIRSNASSTGTRRVNTEGMDEKHALFDKAVGGPIGRRRINKDLKRAGSTGMSEEASLNAMGRLYNKIIGFSVVTRYLVYVVPVALLLVIPIIVLPLTGDKDRVKLGDGARHSLFLLFLWIEISWLTLWAGKMVAHFLPFLFMFFCGVVSSGTRKYATVLRALEIPLSLFFWGLASWLSFKFMFDGANRQWSDVIVRILLSLFLSSAVLLGEKFLVQLISISYHQRSFANRIHDSKREIYLLGLMYEASRTLFPMYCPEFAHEDYIIADSIEVMLKGGKLNSKPGVAAAPMKLVGNVGRLGDKITSVFGNIASEITGKQVFNPNSAHSVVVEALEKVRSSEAMARRIWMSFVVEDQEALSIDDIIEVMGPAHREEAEVCFNAIDADQNGDISLDEMIRKVVEIGKERKAIANSMKDISQALMVFDKVLLFVVLIVVIIIFCKLSVVVWGLQVADLFLSGRLPEQLHCHPYYGWYHAALAVLRLCRHHPGVFGLLHLPLRQASVRRGRPGRHHGPREGAAACREDLPALHRLHAHRQDAGRAGPQHCAEQPLDRERHAQQGHEGGHRRQRLVRHVVRGH